MAQVLTNQQLEYEAAQTPVAFFELTDTGDHLTYSTTNKPWSLASGFEPVYGGYGVISGGVISPAAAAGNNNVDVAALELFAPGMTGASATTGRITIAAATNVAATRGTTNGYRITSITVDSTGTVAAVSGTESTAFSATRGAAGGPPLIPVGSVEIGQVRFTSITAAVVGSSEIYQVPGTHQERADFPDVTPNYLTGKLTFKAALPLIHTGPVTKKVYAKVATPVFAAVSNVKDWVPPETSASVASEEYYDGVVGSSSTSITQGSFTAALNDGVTDLLVKKAGQTLLFRFKPNKNTAPYQLAQGILGRALTFGVKSAPQGKFTLSAAQPVELFDS